jgi:hypothetical protein
MEGRTTTVVADLNAKKEPAGTPAIQNLRLGVEAAQL